jgi:exodeoxyribonuclease VII small subunit
MADKKQSFESSLAQLETIVSEVEAGDIGLEDSITKYENGMKLIKTCQTILNKAEERIKIITDKNSPTEDE